MPGASRPPINPYYFAARYGRGVVLDLDVEAPRYDTTDERNVAALDITGVHDPDASTIAFFAVNRSPDDALAIDLDLSAFGSVKLIEHQVLRHTNTKASNTADRPDEVAPAPGEGITSDGSCLAGRIDPLTYHLIRVEVCAEHS